MLNLHVVNTESYQVLGECHKSDGAENRAVMTKLWRKVNVWEVIVIRLIVSDKRKVSGDFIGPDGCLPPSSEFLHPPHAVIYGTVRNRDQHPDEKRVWRNNKDLDKKKSVFSGHDSQIEEVLDSQKCVDDPPCYRI
ncbi:unnamed protein product [Angiostrongylus costaricensis]|uniref:Uncharacterized protein n=1 Tax=Angiostrongylus costaricensis TaxID=334426 RepID=A0A0R3PDS9_ANGCS|nr:unnamed protein product [Angiostrongylus costaricensis]